MNLPEITHAAILPHDERLEVTIIAQCLLSTESFIEAVVIINDRDFYKDANQRIFNSMVRLYTKSIDPDIVSVISDLTENNELQKIGGVDYVLQIATVLAGVSNISYHAKRLKDLSLKRKCIEYGHSLISKCFKETNTGHQVLSDVLNDAETIFSQLYSKSGKSYGEIVIEEIDNIQQNGGKKGLFTGIRGLDRKLEGLFPGELITIAAGSGEGKTTLVMNIAKNVAERGDGVLYFSKEMTKSELIWKMISNELSVPVFDVRGNKADLKPMKQNHKFLNANFHIYDQAINSVSDVISISKAEYKRKNIKLIIVDYLQLLVDVGENNTHQAISEITRSLKSLAMNLQIPIIQLSQLKRKDGRKYYVLSDLKESGSIENDSNIVIFIWRPVTHRLTYHNFEGIDIDVDESDAFVKIEKSRLGINPEIRLKFNGAASRFEDLPDQDPVFVEPQNKKYAPDSFPDIQKQPYGNIPF